MESNKWINILKTKNENLTNNNDWSFEKAVNVTKRYFWYTILIFFILIVITSFEVHFEYLTFTRFCFKSNFRLIVILLFLSIFTAYLFELICLIFTEYLILNIKIKNKSFSNLDLVLMIRLWYIILCLLLRYRISIFSLCEFDFTPSNTLRNSYVQ